MKWDRSRQYYFQIHKSELEERTLPEVFINVYKNKKWVECQTLDLVKWNQKIVDSHHEVLQLSDEVVETLIEDIRHSTYPLVRISGSIALLDMLASFAQVAITQDYARPELGDYFAVKDGRHALRERIHGEKFVPNDVYATPHFRFTIMTGCNMSGKSTYIRSIALMSIMAQIGTFVPASFASLPIRRQLFARVSMDDNIEANASTFASEMRESAFILRNVEPGSLVIVDELGRGTSTRDGLAIAIAIAEALYASGALVWFVTHFRDVARFLGERPGFQNYHLTVKQEPDRMLMLYKVGKGYIEEEHYGLAMAKVMDLPREVLNVAEVVSNRIASNSERRRKGSTAVIQARKRKLILHLKEQLEHAREGTMQGEVLKRWMKALQDKVVLELVRLEQEEAMAHDDHETHHGSKNRHQSDAELQDDEAMNQSSEPKDRKTRTTYARVPPKSGAEERLPERSPLRNTIGSLPARTHSGITNSSVESGEFERLRGRSMSTEIPENDGSQPRHWMTGALGSHE